jgi:hypothetical protein
MWRGSLIDVVSCCGAPFPFRLLRNAYPALSGAVI